MTLAFSTQINNKPNYFVEKILTGLEQSKLISSKKYKTMLIYYCDMIKPQLSDCSCSKVFKPKLHTFREDINDRWKAENNIHFVINNRTKNRYQFAPILPCVSTQRILMLFAKSKLTIKIDRKTYCTIDFNGKGTKHVKNLGLLAQLAFNDGFDSINDFMDYFGKGRVVWKGKIIHWTNLKY